jgi:hypothetical protein
MGRSMLLSAKPDINLNIVMKAFHIVKRTDRISSLKEKGSDQERETKLKVNVIICGWVLHNVFKRKFYPNNS